MEKKAAAKKTATRKVAAKKDVLEKKTIGVNMNKSIAEELERRAESMQIAVGKYCKIILADWIASGQKLNLSEN